jgi:ParB/RepB/Spo0J family partition protein
MSSTNSRPTIPEPNDSGPSRTHGVPLGRGIDARTSPASPASPNPTHRPGTNASAPPDGALIHVDLDLLDANPFQPRTTIDEATLEELAASIAVSGLLQSIAVRPAGSGRYQIVAGHRRVAAFRRLKTASASEDERRKYRLIPASLKRDMDDTRMAIAAFIENAQREELTPLEEAAALVKIKGIAGCATAKELAAAVGQAEHRVKRLLRLADAPAVVKDAVTNGLLVPVDRGPNDFPPARRERRRLDLIAAIEFIRLYDHILARKPAAAEERVGGAIHRALADGWGFRRIQQYVEATIGGRLEAEAAVLRADADRRPRNGPPPLFERSKERLVIHLAKFDSADRDRLSDVAKLLHDLSLEITARAADAPMPTALRSGSNSGIGSAA